MEEELNHYQGLREEVYDIYMGHTSFVFDEDNPDCLAIVNSASRTVIVPVGVKHLLPGCFVNQMVVEKVYLPDTVETIGGNCFKGCIALEEVYCTDNLTKIEVDAFEDCVKLRRIHNTKGVKTLGALDSILEDAGHIPHHRLKMSDAKEILSRLYHTMTTDIRINFPNAKENLGIFYQNPKGFEIFAKRMKKAWERQGNSNSHNSYYYNFGHGYGYGFNQKAPSFISRDDAKQLFNVDTSVVKHRYFNPPTLGGSITTYDCEGIQVHLNVTVETFPSKFTVFRGAFKKLCIHQIKPTSKFIAAVSDFTLRAVPVFSIGNTESLVIFCSSPPVSTMDISKHHYTSYYWISPRTVETVTINSDASFASRKSEALRFCFPTINKCTSIISRRLYLPIGPNYNCEYPNYYGRFVFVAPLELLCSQCLESADVVDNDADELSQIFGSESAKVLGGEDNEDEDGDESIQRHVKDEKQVSCNVLFYNKFGFVVPIVQGNPEFD